MRQVPFKGYTLLEWLIVTAVTAVLLAVTAPATYAYLARNRLVGATEALAAQLIRARGEAIRQRETVFVHFEDGIHWCASTRVGVPESGTDPVTCAGEVTTVRAADFPGVRIAGISFPRHITSFDPVRGTARPGTLRITGYRGSELRIVLGLLGRVRICAAPGPVSFTRYPAC